MSTESVEVFSNRRFTLSQVMEHAFDFEYCGGVVHIRICLLHCIPHFFGSVKVHKIFSYVISHGVEQQWHYRAIFKYPLLEVGVTFSWFLGLPIDVTFLSLSLEIDRNGSCPLNEILAIQFVASDRESRAFNWIGAIQFVVLHGCTSDSDYRWFRSTSDTMQK